MRVREPWGRSRSESLRAARFDLAFRAFLVATLWAILRLLGGDLNSFVSVAILAAVFGPDAVSAGRDWLHAARKADDPTSV